MDGNNEEIMRINQIEGLSAEINEILSKLPLHPLRLQALEEIDLFQKTTLYELRKAFE